MTKKKGPTKPTRVWGTWFMDPRSPLPNGDYILGNGLYTVHLTPLDPEAGFEGPLQLAIHDRMRSTRHDWREFQRIKNEVVGPEREAVELYPAESRLVDTANEYHLWVAAEGVTIETGFKKRAVADQGHRLDPSDPEVAWVAAGLGMTPEQLSQKLSHAKQRKLQINPEPLKVVEHRVGEPPPPPHATDEQKRAVEQASRDRWERKLRVNEGGGG